jgi:hypothetical protein
MIQDHLYILNKIDKDCDLLTNYDLASFQTNKYTNIHPFIFYDKEAEH